KEIIEVSSNLRPYDKFKVVLKNRIKFVNEYRGVIKLILMESEFNPIVAEYDFIDKITFLIESTVKESGLIVKDFSVLIRIIRGTILSFLYDKETSEENIDFHIARLIEMLIVSKTI